MKPLHQPRKNWALRVPSLIPLLPIPGGALQLNGRMLDQPHLKQAKAVLGID